jgi:hypothetical protein
MIVNVINNTNTLVSIDDLGVTITASGIVDLGSTDGISLYDLADSSDLITKISNRTLTVNDGYNDLSISNAVIYITSFKHNGPTMEDGRPLVRADTRPLGTQTYFTMVGDSVDDEIGNGKVMLWDFSNNDDIYDPNTVENAPIIEGGFKAKKVDIMFNEPVYLKDGTLYFFDAPWGSHCSMYVTVPSGNYYPNPNGLIPAAMLGLSGNDMYAYASKDVFYASFVRKQHMYTNCPMGDELNAEGSQVDPVPAGWYVTGLIVTPESDNVSKGYGSFEMYRSTTSKLPGA